MGFIINGIANVFFEVVGRVIAIMLTLTASINLDIGGVTVVDKFGNLVEEERKGMFDQLLGEGAENFKFAFIVTAFVILILLFLFKLLTSLFAPITGGSEEPITLTISTLISGFLIVFSYDIFKIFQHIANNLLKIFKESAPSVDKFKKDEFYNFAGENRNKIIGTPIKGKGSTKSDPTKNVYANGAGSHESEDDITTIIVCFCVFFVIMINLLKLFLEMYERYVVLGVLFYTAPLAFVAICSKSTMNIFTSWVRMVISQFLLMMMNVFFLSVFAYSFKAQLDAASNNDGFIFADWNTFISYTLIWIGWLMVGQKIDQHLQSVGLSTAQSGGSLAGAMIAAGGTALTAAKMAKNGVGHAINGGFRTRNGLQEKANGGNFMDGFMQDPKKVRQDRHKEAQNERKTEDRNLNEARSKFHTFDDNGREKYDMDAAETIANNSKGITGSEAKDLANAYDLNDTFKKYRIDPTDKDVSWSAKDGIITATDKDGKKAQIAVTDKGFAKAQNSGKALRPITPSSNSAVPQRAEITDFNSQTAKKDVMALRTELKNSGFFKGKENVGIEGNTITWTENGKEYKAVPSYLDTNKFTKPINTDSFVSHDNTELTFNTYEKNE